MSEYPKNTVGALLEWLSKHDPNEIYIGQVFLAENFGIEDSKGEERSPSQEVMKRVETRFWKDSITSNTWEWLAELVWEEGKELGEIDAEGVAV